MSVDFESHLLATAPGFIQRYFETSRLHHLSTWKSDLSEYAYEKMAAKANAGLMECGRASEPSDKYRTIMHIDMDCFFASVGIRDKPHLKDKPVAVAHSVRGTSMDFSSSEIASCNYIARSRGVKNGSYIGSAKKLCPDLVIVPYEFAKYDEVSRLLYDILIMHADFVQAVSCDEAFIDITQYITKKLRQGQVPSAHCNEVIETLSIALAQQIRQDIHRATGCTASVGISCNILLARMATKKAKPNGVHFIHQHQASALLSELPIRDLPGIGHSLENKCKELSLATCGDLSAVSEAQLQLKFGGKTGITLRNFALGIDERKLENKPRQSVSCEINWGMRFDNNEQIDTFLRDLSREVFTRLEKGLQSAGHVSISAKKKLYQGEPTKFLGCGHCEDFSRSMVMNQAISSYDALVEVVLRLYREIGLIPTDVRGIGIHLKNLKSLSGGAAAVGAGGAPAARIQSFFKSGEGVEESHSALLDSVRGVEEEEDEEDGDCQRELLSISGGKPNHLSIKGGRNNNNSTMAVRTNSAADATGFKRKQATLNFQPAAAAATAGSEDAQAPAAASVVKTSSNSSSPSASSKINASSYWHHPPVAIKPKPPVGSFFVARSNSKNKSKTTYVLDEEISATSSAGPTLQIDEEVFHALPPDIQREYAHYQIVKSSSVASACTDTEEEWEGGAGDGEYRWEGVSVDLEVLNSLPEEIRREYIQDMKRQRSEKKDK